MNGLENFRQINSFEKKIIFKSLSSISSKILQVLADLHYFLYISFQHKETKNIYPEVFLITSNQKSYLNLINPKNIISSVGQYFGFIKKNIFFLSLEGTEFLYKNDIFTEFKHLHIKTHGEKAFLYGNDISKDMVDKFPVIIKNNIFLIIFNKLEEILGLALSQCESRDIPRLKPKTIVAINLRDKGYYLRKN
ncbi:MAG: hypothetical protein ACW98D_12425 [Promethearchaeota archaeon]|jgi:ribosome biogenesis protein Nip4